MSPQGKYCLKLAQHWELTIAWIKVEQDLTINSNMGIVRKYNRIRLIRYGNTKTTPFLTECHENLSKT